MSYIKRPLKNYNKKTSFSFPSKAHPWVSVIRDKAAYPVDLSAGDSVQKGQATNKRLDVTFLAGRSKKGKKGLSIKRSKFKIRDSTGRLVRKHNTLSVDSYKFDPNPSGSDLTISMGGARETYHRSTDVYHKKKLRKPSK